MKGVEGRLVEANLSAKHEVIADNPRQSDLELIGDRLTQQKLKQATASLIECELHGAVTRRSTFS